MREDWLDGASMGASILCLLHCLALPILAAALPALSALTGAGEEVHFTLLLVAVPISFAALLTSFRRHRNSLPPVAGCVGVGLLIAALCLVGQALAETALTVAGSLVLAGAHLLNWHFRKVPATGRSAADG